MKKILLPLCILLISTMLWSCNASGDNISTTESLDSSVDTTSNDTSKHTVSSETAFEMLRDLLEKDKKNVELFFENGMYEHTTKNGLTAPIKDDDEYSEYSNVEKLFDIYTFPNVVMQYFCSYPTYGEKAVYEKNGVVYATKINSLSLGYPKLADFSIIELSLDSATFNFETKYGSQTIILDFETNTLSDSPYHLMTKSDYTDKWSSSALTSTVTNLGSGKKLVGKTLIVNVFMSDKNSDWESDEVTKRLNDINEGVKWLQNLADENDVNLNLSSTTPTTSLYYYSSSTLTTSVEDQIWINEMFAYTTYGSLDEYIKTNRNVSAYDNYIVLFHINKKGENNFGRYDSEMFENTLYTTERAVMYSNSTKKDHLNAILYLFGAETFEKAENEAKRYFGNEIMIESSAFNNTTTLSEITAYLIGWKESVHPQLTNLAKTILNK